MLLDLLGSSLNTTAARQSIPPVSLGIQEKKLRQTILLIRSSECHRLRLGCGLRAGLKLREPAHARREGSDCDRHSWPLRRQHRLHSSPWLQWTVLARRATGDPPSDICIRLSSRSVSGRKLGCRSREAEGCRDGPGIQGQGRPCSSWPRRWTIG